LAPRVLQKCRPRLLAVCGLRGTPPGPRTAAKERPGAGGKLAAETGRDLEGPTPRQGPGAGACGGEALPSPGPAGAANVTAPRAVGERLEMPAETWTRRRRSDPPPRVLGPSGAVEALFEPRAAAVLRCTRDCRGRVEKSGPDAGLEGRARAGPPPGAAKNPKADGWHLERQGQTARTTANHANASTSAAGRRASAPCTTPSCASRALIEGSLGHPYTCAEACKHVCKPRGCMDGLASSVCPCRYPVFDRRNKAAGFHGKPPSARGPGQQKREKGRGTRASRELPLAARRSPGRRALGQPSGRAPRESAAPRASGSPRPPPACAGAAGARWGDLQGRVLPEVPLAQRCPQDLQGGPHGPQSTPPLTRSRGPQAPKWSGTLRAPWARGTF
ncbi:unnamed protein product, partial [Prorocentrum cordatum]